MPLIVVTASSGAPAGGVSLPDLVSIGVEDTDGGGGDFYLNGLGITSGLASPAYDLQTIFTGASMMFNSIPLLKAFRKARSAAEAWRQLVSQLDISYYALSAGNVTDPLNLRFDATSDVVNGVIVPLLHVSAADGGEGYTGGLWRLDVKLRHSTTN